MIRDLNIFAQVTRQVVVAPDRTFAVVDSNGVTFMVGMSTPSRYSSSDASPRELDPFILRWRSGLLGLGNQPRAGWRFHLTNPINPSDHTHDVTFELLSDPQEIKFGNSPWGTEVPAQVVTTLYPYEATLKEQDGTAVSPVGVALWSNREDHENTGTYESFSGEAPIEFHSELGDNRRLDIGGERYRLTSSIVDVEGPRVKFEAIRSNA